MRTIPIDERSSLLLQELADVAFDLDQGELYEFWRINRPRVLAADRRIARPAEAPEGAAILG